jgi:magnesium transporter
MLHIHAYNRSAKAAWHPDLHALGELRSREDVWFWVDVTSPTDQEIALLRQHFDFHPIELDKARSLQHHPRLVEYHDHLFLIVHGVSDLATPEEYKPVQLAIFVGQGYLVSVHEPMDEISELLAHCRDYRSLLADGPTRLLHRLFDRVVEEFIPLMAQIEKRVYAVEAQVFQPSTNKLIEEVFTLKRTLVHVRQTAVHQKEVLQRLTQRDYSVTDEDDQFFFRDILEQVVREIDQVDSLKEIVSSVVEANVSLASQRMNEVMKVLTILSTIFLPLTFIAGVYGMNFSYDDSHLNMPELHWSYGYPFVMGTMVVIALGMIQFFRRRKWF